MIVYKVTYYDDSKDGYCNSQWFRRKAEAEKEVRLEVDKNGVASAYCEQLIIDLGKDGTVRFLNTHAKRP